MRLRARSSAASHGRSNGRGWLTRVVLDRESPVARDVTLVPGDRRALTTWGRFCRLPKPQAGPRKFSLEAFDGDTDSRRCRIDPETLRCPPRTRTPQSSAVV